MTNDSSWESITLFCNKADSNGIETLDFRGKNIYEMSNVKLIGVSNPNDIIISLAETGLTYIENFYNNSIENFKYYTSISGPLHHEIKTKDWVLQNIPFYGVAGSQGADNYSVISNQPYYGMGGNDFITVAGSTSATIYAGQGSE